MLLETIAKLLCTQPIECKGEFGYLAGWRTLLRQYHSSHHILVADDDADIRRLSSKVLIRAGYRVDTVEDGVAAWHALKFNNYDLLITDNDMPNLSGVELIEHLVIDHLLLPVILVSGAMPMRELHRISRLRIEGMFLKPYDVPEFLGKVENILGKLTKPTSCLAWEKSG
jgi:DNA-binding NtrC family response regulator